MKLPVKILVINSVIALLIAIIITVSSGVGTSFKDALAFIGMIAMIIGFIDFIVALIFFLFPNKDYAKGFMLSAAVLILGGFSTCTMNM